MLSSMVFYHVSCMLDDFLIMTIRELNTHSACASICRRYDRSKSVHTCPAHPWSWAIGSSQARSPEVVQGGRKLSRIRAVRLQHGLQAFGQRRTTLDRNGAVARTLFEGLMNHGRRLFNQERAIGSHTAFRLAQRVMAPIRPRAGSRANERRKSNRPERLGCPAHP